jgi:predicted Zn-dependent peptidase
VTARAKAGTRPRRARAKVPAGFRAVAEPRVGGTLLVAETKAGTPVLVRPMPGFVKACAVLATRFGSLDTHLPDGREVPQGLAHFLEHKMFATPDGDVFDVYARRGASANAYTTWSHTAYHVTCSSRFPENLATLLGALGTMHADAAGIAREKGIIGQEIAMYDDDPGWRGQANLLSALYRDHPLRLDPAGTKETIAPIDRPLLLATHASYYHPANLVLVVAGDVDPEAVLEAASETLVPHGPSVRHRRAAVPEPREPFAVERRQALSVVRPQVTLGMKDEPPGAEGAALVRREVESELVVDVLFGDGGLVEAPLYREGVIDESFAGSFHAEPDAAFVSVSAEVDDERAYRERLERALDDASRRGIDEGSLERARRKALGALLRSGDGPERAAFMHLGLRLADASLDDVVSSLASATRERVNARMQALLEAPRAWSIVEPRPAPR